MCLGHDSSFMGNVMRPAYLACSNERGTQPLLKPYSDCDLGILIHRINTGRGSHVRRKAVIFEHIQTANIMFDHRWAADIAYSNDVDLEASKVTIELHQEVDGILNDLEALASRSGKSSRSSQVSGFVKDLKLKVDLAQSALEAAQRTLEELVEPEEEFVEPMEETEELMEETEELMDAV